MAEFGGGGGGEQETHAAEHNEGGNDVISVTTALLVDDAVTSAKIASNAVGTTQVDESASFTWTSQHVYEQPVPSIALNRYIALRDTTNSIDLEWVIDDTGTFQNKLGSNIIHQYTPGRSPAEYEIQATTEFSLGIINEDWMDHGGSREIRTEYQSGDDAYAIRDQTNGLDRAQFDRTTGNLDIEGTLNEGATL